MPGRRVLQGLPPATTLGVSSGMGVGRPGVNGSGRRLVQTRRRVAPLIFYPDSHDYFPEPC
jgi:hypothetical protein